MGHIRLGVLPTSRKWHQVVELLRTEADLAEVAAAAVKASELDLVRSATDPAFQFVVRLLVELPLQARSPDFGEVLLSYGFPVASDGSLPDLLAGVNAASEMHAFENGRQSDFAVLAQNALVESLAHNIGPSLPTLFEPEPSEIRTALGRLAGGDRFAVLARDFFARLTFKSLDYYLSRELANHIGTGQRFADTGDRARFEQALFQHTYEAAKIVEAYAGGWYGKTVWQRADLSPKAIEKFASYAFKKMRSELGRRRDAA